MQLASCHDHNAAGGLLASLSARQRSRLVSVALLLLLVVAAVLDRVTMSLEAHEVQAMLKTLFDREEIIALAPTRHVHTTDGADISVFALDPLAGGRDMLLAELQSRCGTVALVATDRAGNVLVSARDYRYLEASGAGHYRFALTVYASMMKAAPYYVLLRAAHGCVSIMRIGVLHGVRRAKDDTLPLMSVFRAEGGAWSALFGSGPAWTATTPRVPWAAQAVRE